MPNHKNLTQREACNSIDSNAHTLYIKCWRGCPRMNNAPLSPILDAVHPGARVHHGFLSQFRAVTDQAPNASMNIKYVLYPFCHGSLLGTMNYA